MRLSRLYNGKLPKFSNYPASLIPLCGWKVKIDVDELSNDERSFPVVRRVDGDLDDFMKVHPSWIIQLQDGQLTISEDAEFDGISGEDMPDLSMSIISEDNPLDNVEFMHKVRSDQRDEMWDGKIVNTLSYRGLCHYMAPCFFVVFNAAWLHGKKYPYERANLSPDDFEKLKYDIKDIKVRDTVCAVLDATDKKFQHSKNNRYMFEGKIMLIHKPTPLNYWHITLNIFASDGSPINRAEKGWRKEVGNIVKDLCLNDMCYVNYLPTEPMPRALYHVQEFNAIHLIFNKCVRYISSLVL